MLRNNVVFMITSIHNCHAMRLEMMMIVKEQKLDLSVLQDSVSNHCLNFDFLDLYLNFH